MPTGPEPPVAPFSAARAREGPTRESRGGPAARPGGNVASGSASATRKGLGRLRRWSGSVRVRASLAALLIVGAAFGLCTAGVVWMLRSSLDSSTTNTAAAEALDIASLITARDRVPHRLAISLEDMAAQVVSSSGQVLSASRNIAGQPPMVDLTAAPGVLRTRPRVVLHPRIVRHRIPHLDLDLDYRFAVAAVGFEADGRSGTVLVANSLGAADHAVGLVEAALAGALGGLALLVAALVWALTGRALRPVERIRAEVAELSATNLRRRLPEPATTDEIGRLARTMNSMLERLAASTERQRQLVADVSHELRNPLAALGTQLEVATLDPSAAPGLLQGSIAEVGAMSSMVDDLLTLARIDEGMLTPREIEVDLDELALLQADRLRSRGKVKVSVRGVGGARLLGDEGQLGRLVANLADNAERHAGSAVSFSVRREGDVVVLEVSDDGPGVPAEHRESIFERFVRLDSARSHRDAGAGLGLAIVREIARAHGGSVEVESAAPGARFVVRLPVRLAPSEATVLGSAGRGDPGGESTEAASGGPEGDDRGDSSSLDRGRALGARRRRFTEDRSRRPPR